MTSRRVQENDTTQDAVRIIYSPKLTDSYKGDALLGFSLLILAFLMYLYSMRDSNVSLLEWLIIFALAGYGAFLLHVASEIYKRYHTMKHYLTMRDGHLIRFRVLRTGERVKDWSVKVEELRDMRLEHIRGMGNYLRVTRGDDSKTVMNDLLYPYVRFTAQEMVRAFNLKIQDLVVGEELEPQEYIVLPSRSEIPEGVQVQKLAELIVNLGREDVNLRDEDGCLLLRVNLKPPGPDSLIIALISGLLGVSLLAVYLSELGLKLSHQLINLTAAEMSVAVGGALIDTLPMGLSVLFLLSASIYYGLSYYKERGTLTVRCLRDGISIVKEKPLEPHEELFISFSSNVRMIREEGDEYYLIGWFSEDRKGVFSLGPLKEEHAAILDAILSFYLR